MLVQEPTDNTNEFEHRLRQLETELGAERRIRKALEEQMKLLEERVRRQEAILERYGLMEEIDNAYAADAKEWLMANVLPQKRAALMKLLQQIEEYREGNRYIIRVKGHKRVAVFHLFHEIALCLDVTQADFIHYIMKHTNLGVNPYTIKSNLRYAR